MIEECIDRSMERIEIVRGGTNVTLFASFASVKYILEGRPPGDVRCMIFDGLPLFRQSDFPTKQKSSEFRALFMRTLWKMIKKHRLLVIFTRELDPFSLGKLYQYSKHYLTTTSFQRKRKSSIGERRYESFCKRKIFHRHHLPFHQPIFLSHCHSYKGHHWNFLRHTITSPRLELSNKIATEFQVSYGKLRNNIYFSKVKPKKI